LGRGDSRIQGVLRELSIEWIGDDSPATGSLKAFFKRAKSIEVEFHAAPVKTIEAANRYLQKTYLARWHRELAAPVVADAHRPLAGDPADVFSKITIRQIQPNGTLHFRGKCYRVEPGQIGSATAGSFVRIEERLDGTVQVTKGETSVRLVPGHVPFAPLPPEEPKKRDRRHNGRPKNREWMANFLKGPRRPLWMVLKPRPSVDLE
jgi:hypothetical protein